VGDLAGFGAIRRWGGLLNAVTLLAFLLVAGWAMLAARGGVLHRRAPTPTVR
jgi:hypothetical protein